MDHQAAYSSAARGGHAEAAYALVRLVRGVLSLSPGRKRSDPSDDCYLSMVLREFSGVVMKHVGGTALLTHFTEEMCRSYQYELANRELKTGTIRLRVATLGSFGKWMVCRDKVVRNPVDRLTRPRRKARVPAVPAWPAVTALLDRCR